MKTDSTLINIDLDKITDIVFDDIDYNDYPDFCDAYISSAKYEGEDLDSDQIDELNDDDEFKYESLMQYIQ